MIQHTPHTPLKVVVIGGGFAGLSAAAFLAKQGCDVVLLEKNKTLGGRARVLHKKGFRFDMGPSWYMMPEVFERFFKHFGKTVADYYQLEQLHPRYQVFFDDKTSLVMSEKLEDNANVFETQEAGAKEKLKEFIEKLRVPYQTSIGKFIYLDIWSVRSWLNFHNVRELFPLIFSLRLWESWHDFVGRFFKNEKLQKIMSFPAVFLGGSPFNTPSIYAVLAWADFQGGAWYPKGGMGAVVEAVIQTAREQGVRILPESDVDRIDLIDGKVVGVTANKQFYQADVVVGACDLANLETKLLPQQYQTWDASYWKKATLSISSMLVYIGLNTRLSKVAHHNMYFSKNWKQNFSEIFEHNTLSADPSFYISVRSMSDRSIVPKNSEEIVLLVPMGSGTVVTKEQLETYADEAIAKTEELLGEPIKKHIVVKEVYGPEQFAQDYHAFQGTALGLAHTFSQSLWLRPNVKSAKVNGLYYAGQYTNPGVGVPTALVSGELVASIIQDEYNLHEEHDKVSDQIFKQGSVTYYYSSLFFRGQVKKDVFALYSYVRVIVDIVDNTSPDLELLEQYWQTTLKEWNEGHTHNLIVERFIELAKRKHFEWEWIEAFWQAMRSDLTKKKYNTFKELETYMYGSAEVVGKMMSVLLDLPKDAITAAALQGKAMQYVNFIRDVKEDIALGRNYLGYSESLLHDPQAWATFLRTQIEHYQKLQQQAEKGYRFIPKKYLIPIKTASDMYAWTAQEIYNNPHIVLERKIKPRRVRVVYQLLENLIRL